MILAQQDATCRASNLHLAGSHRCVVCSRGHRRLKQRQKGLTGSPAPGAAGHKVLWWPHHKQSPSPHALSLPPWGESPESHLSQVQPDMVITSRGGPAALQGEVRSQGPRGFHGSPPPQGRPLCTRHPAEDAASLPRSSEAQVDLLHLRATASQSSLPGQREKGRREQKRRKRKGRERHRVCMRGNRVLITPFLNLIVPRGILTLLSLAGRID